MAAISLTILIFGILNSIYVAAIPSGQLIQSLLLTGTNHVLPSSKENRLFTFQCPSPWVLAGPRCVFVGLSKITSTFDEGRNFCKELHNEADLATFRDANEFEYILKYLRNINSLGKNIHFWIGGRDEQKNNIWTWVDGQPMQMGSPFWGVTSDYEWTPTAGNNKHCAFLYKGNRYFVHEVSCTGGTQWKDNPFVPLCQYDPFTH